jgi:uncharacterized protein (TIGR02757 family)
VSLSPARAAALRPLLDELDGGLDRAARIAADPVELPRRYAAPADQEVAALFAAALAYGRADVFKPVLARVLDAMGPSPAAFVRAFSRAPDVSAFEGAVYRFNRPADLAALAAAAGYVALRHGSLGARFGALYREAELAHGALPPIPPAGARGRPPRVRRPGDEPPGALRAALARFAAELREAPPVAALLRRRGRRGLAHLLPDAAGPGASKRWNLYLRWMVRGPDAVDLGAWRGLVPPAALVVPLDTHVHRVARCLGLTRRTDASWRTAAEITAALRRLDPEDPVRFDFALCHLGMSGACPARRDPARCRACPLAAACGGSTAARREGPIRRGAASGGARARSRLP